jgi:hypothetical protein
MQSAGDFTQEYFRARTAEVRRELEQRVPFRQKFYAGNCPFDRRKGAMENSEGEVVLEIVKFATKATAITKPVTPHPKRRYHLQRIDESWIISSVDIACL